MLRIRNFQRARDTLSRCHCISQFQCLIVFIIFPSLCNLFHHQSLSLCISTHLSTFTSLMQGCCLNYVPLTRALPASIITLETPQTPVSTLPVGSSFINSTWQSTSSLTSSLWKCFCRRHMSKSSVPWRRVVLHRKRLKVLLCASLNCFHGDTLANCAD